MAGLDDMDHVRQGVVWQLAPAADTWRERRTVPTPRGAGQAVAVRGKIAVIGGVDPKKRGQPDAPIPVGSSAWIVRGTVEACDPASGDWWAFPHMQVARPGFIATCIGRALHVAGGSLQSDGTPGIAPGPDPFDVRHHSTRVVRVGSKTAVSSKVSVNIVQGGQKT